MRIYDKQYDFIIQKVEGIYVSLCNRKTTGMEKQ